MLCCADNSSLPGSALLSGHSTLTWCKMPEQSLHSKLLPAHPCQIESYNRLLLQELLPKYVTIKTKRPATTTVNDSWLRESMHRRSCASPSFLCTLLAHNVTKCAHK
eukprot:4510630-Amphidinium_carterae.1